MSPKGRRTLKREKCSKRRRPRIFLKWSMRHFPSIHSKRSNYSRCSVLSRRKRLTNTLREIREREDAIRDTIDEIDYLMELAEE